MLHMTHSVIHCLMSVGFDLVFFAAYITSANSKLFAFSRFKDGCGMTIQGQISWVFNLIQIDNYILCMHEVVHACIHTYVKTRKQLLGLLCGHHL